MYFLNWFFIGLVCVNCVLGILCPAPTTLALGLGRLKIKNFGRGHRAHSCLVVTDSLLGASSHFSSFALEATNALLLPLVSHLVKQEKTEDKEELIYEDQVSWKLWTRLKVEGVDERRGKGILMLHAGGKSSGKSCGRVGRVSK